MFSECQVLFLQKIINKTWCFLSKKTKMSPFDTFELKCGGFVLLTPSFAHQRLVRRLF
jgi:hypothetical protein